jgi:protein-S-isoprenylcysteine O-methyltransferase Ste14
VVAQVVVGAAVVVLGFLGSGWPAHVADVLLVLGLAVGGAGAVLFGWGIASLGASLTPYPRPHEGGTLRAEGVYAHVRHPIYGGVLLMALGWSLALSPLALAATAILWLLLELKARHEESLLLERYPEYGGYAARVRKRFVPGVR